MVDISYVKDNTEDVSYITSLVRVNGVDGGPTPALVIAATCVTNALAMYMYMLYVKPLRSLIFRENSSFPTKTL